MKPESVAKLLQLPEGRELVAFLESELAKLKDMSFLNALHNSTPDQVSLLVWSRFHSLNTLESMLAPFINTQQKPVGTNPDDFLV